MNRNNTDWNELYKVGDTGWDIGKISSPLKKYVDQLYNKDIRILIPGCGNGHEVQYLVNELSFTQVYVIDISVLAIEGLRKKIPHLAAENLICGDFFAFQGQFDLILEQTFFCAIRPWRRWEYVNKMYDLLKPGGKLVGLMFSEEFDREGPPFGGDKEEYKRYFSEEWKVKTMEDCYNSIEPRMGRELFINIEKK